MSEGAVRPGIYRHYKGGLYTVIGLANDAEPSSRSVTTVTHVIYADADGRLWLRTIEDFTARVGDGKGGLVQRFTRATEAP